MNDQYQSNEKPETVCGSTMAGSNRHPSAFYQG